MASDRSSSPEEPLLGILKFFRKAGGSKDYPLYSGETTFGRSDDADIRIKLYDKILLGIHCVIDVDNTGVARLMNNGDRQTVTVNDVPVRKFVTLKDQDMIVIMDKVFQYCSKKGSENNKQDKAIPPKQSVTSKWRLSMVPTLPSKSSNSSSKVKPSSRITPVRKPERKSLYGISQTTSKVISKPSALPKRALRFSLGNHKGRIRTPNKSLKMITDSILSEEKRSGRMQASFSDKTIPLISRNNSLRRISSVPEDSVLAVSLDKSHKKLSGKSLVDDVVRDASVSNNTKDFQRQRSSSRKNNSVIVLTDTESDTEDDNIQRHVSYVSIKDDSDLGPSIGTAKKSIGAIARITNEFMVHSTPRNRAPVLSLGGSTIKKEYRNSSCETYSSVDGTSKSLLVADVANRVNLRRDWNRSLGNSQESLEDYSSSRKDSYLKSRQSHSSKRSKLHSKSMTNCNNSTSKKDNSANLQPDWCSQSTLCLNDELMQFNNSKPFIKNTSVRSGSRESRKSVQSISRVKTDIDSSGEDVGPLEQPQISMQENFDSSTKSINVKKSTSRHSKNLENSIDNDDELEQPTNSISFKKNTSVRSNGRLSRKSTRNHSQGKDDPELSSEEMGPLEFSNISIQEKFDSSFKSVDKSVSAKKSISRLSKSLEIPTHNKNESQQFNNTLSFDKNTSVSAGSRLSRKSIRITSQDKNQSINSSLGPLEQSAISMQENVDSPIKSVNMSINAKRSFSRHSKNLENSIDNDDELKQPNNCISFNTNTSVRSVGRLSRKSARNNSQDKDDLELSSEELGPLEFSNISVQEEFDSSFKSVDKSVSAKKSISRQSKNLEILTDSKNELMQFNNSVSFDKNTSVSAGGRLSRKSIRNTSQDKNQSINSSLGPLELSAISMQGNVDSSIKSVNISIDAKKMISRHSNNLENSIVDNDEVQQFNNSISSNKNTSVRSVGRLSRKSTRNHSQDKDDLELSSEEMGPLEFSNISVQGKFDSTSKSVDKSISTKKSISRQSKNLEILTDRKNELKQFNNSVSVDKNTSVSTGSRLSRKSIRNTSQDKNQSINSSLGPLELSAISMQGNVDSSIKSVNISIDAKKSISRHSNNLENSIVDNDEVQQLDNSISSNKNSSVRSVGRLSRKSTRNHSQDKDDLELSSEEMGPLEFSNISVQGKFDSTSKSVDKSISTKKSISRQSKNLEILTDSKNELKQFNNSVSVDKNTSVSTGSRLSRKSIRNISQDKNQSINSSLGPLELSAISMQGNVDSSIKSVNMSIDAKKSISRHSNNLENSIVDNDEVEQLDNSISSNKDTSVRSVGRLSRKSTRNHSQGKDDLELSSEEMGPLEFSNISVQGKFDSSSKSVDKSISTKKSISRQSKNLEILTDSKNELKQFNNSVSVDKNTSVSTGSRLSRKSIRNISQDKNQSINSSLGPLELSAISMQGNVDSSIKSVNISIDAKKSISRHSNNLKTSIVDKDEVEQLDNSISSEKNTSVRSVGRLSRKSTRNHSQGKDDLELSSEEMGPLEFSNISDQGKFNSSSKSVDKSISGRKSISRQSENLEILTDSKNELKQFNSSVLFDKNTSVRAGSRLSRKSIRNTSLDKNQSMNSSLGPLELSAISMQGNVDSSIKSVNMSIDAKKSISRHSNNLENSIVDNDEVEQLDNSISSKKNTSVRAVGRLSRKSTRNHSQAKDDLELSSEEMGPLEFSNISVQEMCESSSRTVDKSTSAKKSISRQSKNLEMLTDSKDDLKHNSVSFDRKGRKGRKSIRNTSQDKNQSINSSLGPLEQSAISIQEIVDSSIKSVNMSIAAKKSISRHSKNLENSIDNDDELEQPNNSTSFNKNTSVRSVGRLSRKSARNNTQGKDDLELSSEEMGPMEHSNFDSSIKSVNMSVNAKKSISRHSKNFENSIDDVELEQSSNSISFKKNTSVISNGRLSRKSTRNNSQGKDDLELSLEEMRQIEYLKISMQENFDSSIKSVNMSINAKKSVSRHSKNLENSIDYDDELEQPNSSISFNRNTSVRSVGRLSRKSTRNNSQGKDDLELSLKEMGPLALSSISVQAKFDSLVDKSMSAKKSISRQCIIDQFDNSVLFDKNTSVRSGSRKSIRNTSQDKSHLNSSLGPLEQSAISMKENDDSPIKSVNMSINFKKTENSIINDDQLEQSISRRSKNVKKSISNSDELEEPNNSISLNKNTSVRSVGSISRKFSKNYAQGKDDHEISVEKLEPQDYSYSSIEDDVNSSRRSVNKSVNSKKSIPRQSTKWENSITNNYDLEQLNNPVSLNKNTSVRSLDSISRKSTRNYSQDGEDLEISLGKLGSPDHSIEENVDSFRKSVNKSVNSIKSVLRQSKNLEISITNNDNLEHPDNSISLNKSASFRSVGRTSRRSTRNYSQDREDPEVSSDKFGPQDYSNISIEDSDDTSRRSVNKSLNSKKSISRYSKNLEPSISNNDDLEDPNNSAFLKKNTSVRSVGSVSRNYSQDGKDLEISLAKLGPQDHSVEENVDSSRRSVNKSVNSTKSVSRQSKNLENSITNNDNLEHPDNSIFSNKSASFISVGRTSRRSTRNYSQDRADPEVSSDNFGPQDYSNVSIEDNNDISKKSVNKSWNTKKSISRQSKNSEYLTVNDGKLEPLENSATLKNNTSLRSVSLSSRKSTRNNSQDRNDPELSMEELISQEQSNISILESSRRSANKSVTSNKSTSRRSKNLQDSTINCDEIEQIDKFVLSQHSKNLENSTINDNLEKFDDSVFDKSTSLVTDNKDISVRSRGRSSKNDSRNNILNILQSSLHESQLQEQSNHSTRDKLNSIDSSSRSQTQSKNRTSKSQQRISGSPVANKTSELRNSVRSNISLEIENLSGVSDAHFSNTIECIEQDTSTKDASRELPEKSFHADVNLGGTLVSSTPLPNPEYRSKLFSMATPPNKAENDSFKTPQNTPGIFEDLRRSILSSKRRSTYKRPPKDFDCSDTPPTGVKRHRESSMGMDVLHKRRKLDATKEISEKNTIGSQNAAESPRNDLTSPEGVTKLMATPKIDKSPKNDLSSPKGVRQLMATPKPRKSSRNDLTSPKGVRKIMATPKPNKSPKNDLSSPKGVRKLMATLKPRKSPKNDLTSPKGVRKIMATPKPYKSPKNDLSSPKGLRKLMTTPKPTKSPRNDLSNVEGVKELMSSILETSSISNLSPPKRSIEVSDDSKKDVPQKGILEPPSKKRATKKGKFDHNEGNDVVEPQVEVKSKLARLDEVSENSKPKQMDNQNEDETEDLVEMGKIEKPENTVGKRITRKTKVDINDKQIELKTRRGRFKSKEEPAKVELEKQGKEIEDGQTGKPEAENDTKSRKTRQNKKINNDVDESVEEKNELEQQDKEKGKLDVEKQTKLRKTRHNKKTTIDVDKSVEEKIDLGQQVNKKEDRQIEKLDSEKETKSRKTRQNRKINSDVDEAVEEKIELVQQDKETGKLDAGKETKSRKTRQNKKTNNDVDESVDLEQQDDKKEARQIEKLDANKEVKSRKTRQNRKINNDVDEAVEKKIELEQRAKETEKLDVGKETKSRKTRQNKKTNNDVDESVELEQDKKEDKEIEKLDVEKETKPRKTRQNRKINSDVDEAVEEKIELAQQDKETGKLDAGKETKSRKTRQNRKINDVDEAVEKKIELEQQVKETGKPDAGKETKSRKTRQNKNINNDVDEAAEEKIELAQQDNETGKLDSVKETKLRKTRQNKKTNNDIDESVDLEHQDDKKEDRLIEKLDAKKEMKPRKTRQNKKIDNDVDEAVEEKIELEQQDKEIGKLDAGKETKSRKTRQNKKTNKDGHEPVEEKTELEQQDKETEKLDAGKKTRKTRQNKKTNSDGDEPEEDKIELEQQNKKEGRQTRPRQNKKTNNDVDETVKEEKPKTNDKDSDVQSNVASKSRNTRRQQKNKDNELGQEEPEESKARTRVTRKNKSEDEKLEEIKEPRRAVIKKQEKEDVIMPDDDDIPSGIGKSKKGVNKRKQIDDKHLEPEKESKRPKKTVQFTLNEKDLLDSPSTRTRTAKRKK